MCVISRWIDYKKQFLDICRLDGRQYRGIAICGKDFTMRKPV